MPGTANALNISQQGTVYFDGVSLFSGLDGGTAGNALISQGTGVAPAYGLITVVGTITTGVWQGTPIALAYGGTNANLTASNGGIFYSTATAGAILAGTATANQVLLSGSSTTPAWSTATYPASTTVSQLLYSSSNNVIAGLATANDGVLITSNTGVPSWLANSGTPGYVLTANSGAPPSWQAAASSTMTFTDEATSFAAAANNGYFVSAAATATLPASPSQGNIVVIVSDTASAVVIQANTGQVIRMGSSVSTTAGTATSTARGDAVVLVYRASGTAWIAQSAPQGIWTTA